MHRASCFNPLPIFPPSFLPSSPLVFFTFTSSPKHPIKSSLQSQGPSLSRSGDEDLCLSQICFPAVLPFHTPAADLTHVAKITA